MSAAFAERPAPVRRVRTVLVSTRVSKSASARVSKSGRNAPDEARRDRSHLRVVAPISKSKFSLATKVILSITSLLAVVVVFQTVIAEQQLRLDKVSTDVRLARQHYDELRQQRAELRAPDYLREQAMMLGMSQGVSSKFAAIPADVVASVLASTGSMDKKISQPPVGDELFPQTLTSVTP